MSQNSKSKKKKKAEAAPAAINLPKKSISFNKADLVPFILVCLFMFVDLIPRLGSTDVMGPQWVYVAIINLASIVFILTAKKDIPETSARRIFTNPLSLVYISFLLLAGLSIFVAMNKIESLVSYARLIITG